MNNQIIVNPFLNMCKSDTISDLYNNYNNVFIICNNSDVPIDRDIYQYYIDESKLNEIKKKFLLVRTSINILRNINHKNRLIVLSDKTLQEINIFNYKLSERNIGLLMLNINYENVNIYLSQFKNDSSLEDIFKVTTINTYFNDNNQLTFNKVDKLLNFEDSNYWSYKYRCNINLSDVFNKRKFNISDTVMKEIGCYLNNIYKTKEYIDPSKVITSGQYKYKVFNEKSITKEDINSLFETLNEKQKYILFCNLIVSKRYCHLALNNIYLLRLMKDTIHKYIELFRYLISYTWLRFYFDESIKKSYMNKNDNFIFDINTASELPMFPFLQSSPKVNPYMPILVNDSSLNSENNIGGVSDFVGKNNSNNICNLDEFKKRVNIFCSNNSKNNIFEFIEWEKDKIAIGGSMMAACLQRNHPLLNLFANIANDDDRLARFYNEYYGLADVDIMFLSNDELEYMERVNKFYNQVVVNICNLYPTYAEPSHTRLISDKIAYLFVDNETCLKMFNNSYDTIIEVKKTIEEPETRKLFEPLFINGLNKIKKERLSKFTEEEIKNISVLYPDYFDFDNIPFRVRFIKSKSDNDNNVIINYKYKIKSPHINHTLELFSVKYDDFFCTVQSFHLPCVRSYYDGNNVYMTPSCVSAHLTYMNIDYKYFAGSRDPIDIINKYRMRGFGTWLNENEKNTLSKYSKHNVYWNNLYNIYDDADNQTCGFFSINHKLYHPRMYNLDFYHDAFPIDWTEPYNVNNESKKIETSKEFYSELSVRYKNSVNFDFLNNMKAVGINGSIRKLQKWVIEGCWNIVQSNIKKKPSNVVIANKITKKVTKKIKSYDISGNYNLGLSPEDKAIKINKIQNNYTPQYVQTLSGSVPTYTPVNTISGPVNTISGPVNTISGPVNTISGPVNTISGPVNTISGPVNTISGPVNTISGPVNTISGPVNTISGPVNTISGHINIISGPLNNNFDDYDIDYDVEDSDDDDYE